MNTIAQWIHQNNILISTGLLFLASAGLVSWFRLWTRKRLALWFCSFLIIAAGLFWLKTPAATVSGINQLGEENRGEISQAYLDFASIDEIESYLAADSKPTLVEFYSDFGFS